MPHPRLASPPHGFHHQGIPTDGPATPAAQGLTLSACDASHEYRSVMSRTTHRAASMRATENVLPSSVPPCNQRTLHDRPLPPCDASHAPAG